MREMHINIDPGTLPTGPETRLIESLRFHLFFNTFAALKSRDQQLVEGVVSSAGGETIITLCLKGLTPTHRHDRTGLEKYPSSTV